MFLDITSRDRGDALFIVVEGNIGAGKSTFCNLLGHHRQARTGQPVSIFPEPVHKPEFRKLLDFFYKDQKRWSFLFQMYALTERYSQHLQAIALVNGGITVIQDRSIYADSCFGATCHESDQMNDLEWTTYGKTFSNMKQGMRYPDVMIYLRTTPEVCKERMDRRKRPEEAGVPLEYLKKLHGQHDALAKDMKSFIPVVEVDWDDCFGDRIPGISDLVDKAIEGRKRFVRDFRLI